jgi:hypothetical protein
MSGFLSSMVGATYASAAVAFADGLTSLSNISYNYQQYTNPQLSYVGADSSNNPVFLFCYSDSSNTYPKGMVFRVNSDGSTTQGSVVTFNSAAGADPFNTSSHTEYPDASQGWVYYTVATTSYLKAKTFAITKDSLTIETPGSEFALTDNSSQAVDASFMASDYAGNNRGLITFRGGPGGNTALLSRSGNTISQVAYRSDGPGDQSVLHGVRSFAYRNLSNGLYRYMWNSYGADGEFGYFNGATNGTQRWFGADNGNVGLLPTAGYTQASVNTVLDPSSSGNTPKILVTGRNGSNLVHQAATMTFPTSGTAAGSSVLGSVLTSADATTNLSWTTVQGFANNEAYVIYKNSSNSNWYYRKITASTNTLSEGSAVQITNFPTNWPTGGWFARMCASASTSTGNWIVAVADDSTTSTPNLLTIKV